MTANQDLSVGKRIEKATGWIGGLSFLLIYFASAVGGFRFDAFCIGLLALMLVWTRSWMLVPQHLQYKQMREDEITRYHASDWKLLEVLSELSGSEIDELRGTFKMANNRELDQFFLNHRPNWSTEQKRKFLTYLSLDWVDADYIYVAENGELRDIDK